ncbi:MAG: choice-of-anchor B family protein, partial [Xanthomonadales bacterium]|nr:choice-of-anchor B family protein [Xanthomonadales bacterium]
WDVSDLDAPLLAGYWDAAGQAIDHNQYVKGSFTYQANYRRGLRILEIVDPDKGALSEYGFFDTYPAADGNSFSGAWSVYPFFESGVVVVSDISRGLFILRANLPDLEFEDDFESAGAR